MTDSDKKCEPTHHNACACREAHFTKLEADSQLLQDLIEMIKNDWQCSYDEEADLFFVQHDDDDGMGCDIVFRDKNPRAAIEAAVKAESLRAKMKHKIPSRTDYNKQGEIK